MSIWIWLIIIGIVVAGILLNHFTNIAGDKLGDRLQRAWDRRKSANGPSGPVRLSDTYANEEEAK